MSPITDAEARARREEEADVDRGLVARAIDGDRAAFGQLVERYQKRVYSVAFGILRDREDAWDVAQEAFVKAYRNLGRFEGTSAFYTWMYRITHNLAIDHYRSRRRRDVVPVEETRKLEVALEKQDKPTFEVDPSETTDRAELTRVLHDAMSKLSEKHRAIIVLREVEGLSYEEIADVLGIKKGTVMSRLFHARKNLQALLQPYVDAGDSVPDSLQIATEQGGAG